METPLLPKEKKPSSIWANRKRFPHDRWPPLTSDQKDAKNRKDPS
jgi:hypothetical protein